MPHDAGTAAPPGGAAPVDFATPEAAAALARQGARRLAQAKEADVARLVGELSTREALGLRWLFEFWALPHQLPPEGGWRTWVCMGGRGAGKTRAGAEWVRAQVEGPRARDPGPARRVALVADTVDQAREVMVMGESGLLACTPADRRPEWIATRRVLRWPNGAEAQLFSAHQPERLRGPQFDCAWVDELAKWRRGEAWDMLQFGLRLGGDPRSVVTTTPRNAPLLKGLLARASTVTTHAPTSANRAHLARGFLDEVHERYAQTRLGRQELEGMMLDDVEGALWTGAMIAAARSDDPAPPLDQIVVGVDPSVSSGKRSDECGIVVVGVERRGGRPQEWRAWVLEDATVQGASPGAWAAAVLAARERWGAERIVAEVNQGGDLVLQNLRTLDPLVPFKAVFAGRSKAVRAGPVATLYEQGRVRHVHGPGAGLGALEEQMGLMTWDGYAGPGSPDRLDALVWALGATMVDPIKAWREPQLRQL